MDDIAMGCAFLKKCEVSVQTGHAVRHKGASRREETKWY